MRVLHVEDLRFEDFPGLPDDPYAILSHIWSCNEITYQQVINKIQAQRLCIPAQEEASAKFEGCRSQARKDNLKYLWIDTCCIDKANHCEFSEVINSVYHWYQEAHVCYTYLGDVVYEANMSKSTWFTRGWTLQELLAPTRVEFFNQG